MSLTPAPPEPKVTAETAADLGQLLAVLRERAGLKMADVITITGVKRATAYWTECRRSRPEPELLGQLLDLYGASPVERLKAWAFRARPAPKPSKNP